VTVGALTVDPRSRRVTHAGRPVELVVLDSAADLHEANDALHALGVRTELDLEIEFASEERRDAFRTLPVVTAALDAVPDPAHGLLVYPGRGGGAGSRMPRRPRPLPMAGAGAVPVPEEQVRMGLAEALPPMFSDVG